MAQDERIVRVINEAGQVVRVRESHPILQTPGIKVLPAGVNPDEPDDPIPYEDWAPQDLMEYAERNGIDVGQATSARTLARRIRAHESATE